MNKYSYENKKVYLGLDVHKRTYALTARCEGGVIKKDVIPARPTELLKYITRHFKGGEVHSAYEAGFCGFHLHRFLKAHGINNIIVHPSSIEIAARDRVKNDKRDSMKIATQLEAERLRGIHVPSEEREQLREVTRHREELLKCKKRLTCQIKSLLSRHGMGNENPLRMTEKWIKEFSGKDLPKGIKFVFNDYAASWLDLSKRIQRVENELKEQATSEGKLQQIVQSVPGIGPVASRVLLNELGDMSQFSNVKHLYSYCGLTPQEYSSGEHRRLGHISRQGRGILRKTLVQAAWVAIRYDKQLLAMFEELSFRTGKKKAIVAIARKLIGRIRACIKRGKNYFKINIETGEITYCT